MYSQGKSFARKKDKVALLMEGGIGAIGMNLEWVF
jgi:hypothetical protein